MPEGRSKSEEEIHTFAQHKMRKQDSAHADSGQKRSLYRRAHETSPDIRSSETGIGRAWEIPVLASETLTAFTRTACCFIGRFCEQGSAQSGVRLASPVLCFFLPRSPHDESQPSVSPEYWKASSRVRQDGICNGNAAQHHLGVRKRSR